MMQTKRETMQEARKLVTRSMLAHVRAGGTYRPDPEHSGIVELQGRRYIRMATAARTHAVYRVEAGQRLRRLAKWPPELETGPN